MNAADARVAAAEDAVMDQPVKVYTEQLFVAVGWIGVSAIISWTVAPASSYEKERLRLSPPANLCYIQVFCSNNFPYYVHSTSNGETTIIWTRDGISSLHHNRLHLHVK